MTPSPSLFPSSSSVPLTATGGASMIGNSGCSGVFATPPITSNSSGQERRFTFEVISPGGRTHLLQALSLTDLEVWVRALRSGLLTHHQHQHHRDIGNATLKASSILLSGPDVSTLTLDNVGAEIE
ncbi:unnamed protein product [Protopolystoma xenopodis]|uniref:PH domain-containing protein n=1 Tax=Protopolystoma xenopodis TaxID=117903 RepID=A0A3S5CVE8_9PLAT|nr:unnamed protein product [Protopolystoma xenopodis]